MVLYVTRTTECTRFYREIAFLHYADAIICTIRFPIIERRNKAMSIYKKLHEIQKSLRGLAKDKTGHGYTYVSGEKVLSSVRAKMDELGVILKQEILSIDNERIDYKTGIGTTYEKPKSEILSKVMMKFTWVCIDTDTKDENSFGANGQNDWDKGVGSAMTYGERYFILKYFHIPTDQDDIDSLDRSSPTDQDDKAKKIAKPISLAQGKSQIESALTISELTSIYNSNQHLHVQKEFTEALSSKKNQLNGK